MQDLVTVLSNEDGIQISLDVQQDAVLQIGEMMQEIQEEAYMNGENWAIFFQYYLEQYAPDLLEGLVWEPDILLRYPLWSSGFQGTEDLPQVWPSWGLVLPH